MADAEINIKIEENADAGYIRVSRDDVRLNAFLVKNSGRWNMFKIESEGSVKVPDEISGSFTNRKSALDAVVVFLRKSKKTSSFKRQEINLERELRKGTANAPVILAEGS